MVPTGDLQKATNFIKKIGEFVPACLPPLWIGHMTCWGTIWLEPFNDTIELFRKIFWYSKCGIWKELFRVSHTWLWSERRNIYGQNVYFITVLCQKIRYRRLYRTTLFDAFWFLCMTHFIIFCGLGHLKWKQKESTPIKAKLEKTRYWQSCFQNLHLFDKNTKQGVYIWLTVHWWEHYIGL